MTSSIHPIDKWWNVNFRYNERLSEDLQHLITVYADEVARYVRETNSGDNFGPGYAHPSSAVGSMDIHELPRLLEIIFQRQQELEGIPEQERFEVRMSRTDSKVERDVLTWKLKKRLPGMFERGSAGTNSSKVKEVKAHKRHEFDDPTHAGHKIIAYGQRYTNLIELCYTSGQPDTANQRAIWIEDVIDTYQYLFHYFGIVRFIYLGREEDQNIETGEGLVYKRRLCYHVETEKIKLVRTQTIREVILTIYLQSVAQAAQNN